MDESGHEGGKGQEGAKEEEDEGAKVANGGERGGGAKGRTEEVDNRSRCLDARRPAATPDHAVLHRREEGGRR